MVWLVLGSLPLFYSLRVGDFMCGDLGGGMQERGGRGGERERECVGSADSRVRSVAAKGGKTKMYDGGQLLTFVCAP